MQAHARNRCADRVALRLAAGLLACAFAAPVPAAKRPPKVEIVPDATGFTITQEVRVSGDVRADYDQALRLLAGQPAAPGIALLVGVTESAPDAIAPSSNSWSATRGRWRS